MDEPVKQLLVAVVHGEQGKALGQDGRDRDLPQRLHYRPVEQRVHVLIPYYVPGPPERGSDILGRLAPVLRNAQPLRCPAADLRRPELGGQDIRREEVVLHEVAETPADPVLPAWNDGGMRDRDTQRVPEQRGDGEPVRNAADHRCLGGGPDVAQPGVPGLERPRADEDEPHQDQETGRPELHAVEVPLPLLGVADVLHGRR
jgi:hypothetical protein